MSVLQSKSVDDGDVKEDISDIKKLNSIRRGMTNGQITGYLYQNGFRESGNLLRYHSSSIRCVVTKIRSFKMITSKGSKRKANIKPSEWEYLSERYRKGETIFFLFTFKSDHHKSQPALGSGKRLPVKKESNIKKETTKNEEIKNERLHACMLKLVRNGENKWFDSNNYSSKGDLRRADRRYKLLRNSLLPLIKTKFNLKERVRIIRESIIRIQIEGSCSMQLTYIIESFINNYTRDQLGHSIRLQLMFLYKITRFLKYYRPADSAWYTNPPAWTLEPFLVRLANGLDVSRQEIGASLKELEDSDLKTRWRRPRGDFIETRSFRTSKK